LNITTSARIEEPGKNRQVSEGTRVRGRIQTVLGAIEPEAAGICLPHEHLALDLTYRFVMPDDAEERRKALEPISLENLSWVREQPTASRENFCLDETLTVPELQRYKEAGGGTVVELTLDALGRNPEALARIARRTGLHIVMGCGYYEAGTHPPELAGMSEQQIADTLVSEFTDGVGNTGIRPGIIGEIGCSWPLLDAERKCLSAAAIAQSRTGAAITIHPGRHPDAPNEIMELLIRAGSSADRVIMSHCDRTLFQEEHFLQAAATGCYLELDLFGWETSYYPWEIQGRFPTDAARIDAIRTLIGKGYREKILVSHDICTRMQLRSYGGHGYAHLLTRAVPLMRKQGLLDADIQCIMQENPQRILTFQ
jgi:phosphotriesterase-related protein